MREKLISLIEEQTEFRPILEETTFAQMGLDSLDFLLLLQEIRDQIGPVTDAQAIRAQKLGDLMVAVGV